LTTLAERLRYLRHQLDIFNAMRLNGPLDESTEGGYQQLCALERELLTEARPAAG
jgi:hypothetical protein